MREVQQLQASTIRRRLAALSSLFGHLVRHGVVAANPVRDVDRPRVSRRQGKTLAFSRRQARRLLDAPSPHTIQGLRDRAILAVGLQVGLRRAEITTLKVRDLHQNRGFDSLWVNRKGGKRESVAVHPQVAQRIRDYLIEAGHVDESDGPHVSPGTWQRIFEVSSTVASSRCGESDAQEVQSATCSTSQAFRRTRCEPRLSRRHSITGRISKMFKGMSVMLIQRRPSCMIAAATIRKRVLRSLRITDELYANTLAINATSDSSDTIVSTTMAITKPVSAMRQARRRLLVGVAEYAVLAFLPGIRHLHEWEIVF